VADSSTFFADLPSCESLDHGLDPSHLTPLPDDWTFLMTDVVDSTKTIEQGGYRRINMTGAACITAVLNALGRPAIPYVFCGDGAQIACHCSQEMDALRALHAVARRVQRLYDLKLRTTAYRVASLRAHGHPLLVGKIAVSPTLNQAVFWGSGLDAVETWIRTGPAPLERIEDVGDPNLEGLECRWQEVPSARAEIVNLLVLARPEGGDPATTYKRVLELVDTHLGPPHQRHPLHPAGLRLMVSAAEQAGEVDLRLGPVPLWKRNLRKQWNALETRVGRLFMKHRLRIMGVDWGRYLDEVIGYSDPVKFTGMLALMASASKPDRERLVAALEAEQAAGTLRFGIHVSRSSLITCMVLDRRKEHHHFVDGGRGGYAMAARDLRSRPTA
jgi:hypothetical protein